MRKTLASILLIGVCAAPALAERRQHDSHPYHPPVDRRVKRVPITQPRVPAPPKIARRK